jgi:superfamily II DNA helicase RecQ
MPYAFFKIRANDHGEDAGELNQFLRSHRVLAVRSEWVAAGEDSFWAFCVDFLDRPAAADGTKLSNRRVDYKEVLSPDHFAIYARLRDLRKTMAEAEGVPVFTVFTNQQLAAMVQQGCRSRAALEEIDGIGAARVEKYGDRFLEALAEGGKEAVAVEEREGLGT